MKVFAVVTVSNHETDHIMDNVDVEMYKEESKARERLKEIADEHNLVLSQNEAVPEEYEYDGSYEVYIDEQTI
tara:strand:- start:177 stop:395 length:219 start_codon:yes stop_codon:yes gene_type:complete